MARRGLVLKLLTALKQICNHPARYLKQAGPLPGRSGKLVAVDEILDIVTAEGDAAFVFTQYVSMGQLAREPPGVGLEPDPRNARPALRPMVEPGRRGSGDGPGVPHRSGPSRPGAPSGHRGNRGGPSRPAAHPEACPVGGCRRSRRDLADRAQRQRVARPRPTGGRIVKRRAYGRTWWGQAWVEALEGRARLDPNRLPRGRTYARAGHVGELTVAPGEVRAPVQGSRRTPYSVRVRVRTFDAREWDELVDAIAAELGHTAALLDGELPPGVADDAKAAGLDLLPGAGDVQPRCSCPDWSDPCKHSAAVCYLIAEQLDADPFGLLLLRGLGREDVLARVRGRRRAPCAHSTPVETDADEGVMAQQVWEATVARPPLPRIPLPPRAAGAPVALPSPGARRIRYAGGRLAAARRRRRGARTRICALGGTGSSSAVDPGRPGPLGARQLGGPEFARLVANAGVPGRVLARDALAWRAGGQPALEVIS